MLNYKILNYPMISWWDRKKEKRKRKKNWSRYFVGRNFRKFYLSFWSGEPVNILLGAKRELANFNWEM